MIAKTKKLASKASFTPISDEDLLFFLRETDVSPKPLVIRNPDYERDFFSILQFHFSCAYPASITYIISIMSHSG
ncbi:MAG: hypothetical protein AAFQ14_02860 [Cyanobacteria bacterium J06621_12]